MSTVTTKPAATNGQAKEKKSAAVRKSAKQIIAERKNKGILSVMVKAAFSLGAKNNFDGTDAEGNVKQHTVVYQITKEGGKIDKLDDKGTILANLITKAKACHADLSSDEPTYSKNVKMFINEVLKLQAPTESMSAVLRGVTFA